MEIEPIKYSKMDSKNENNTSQLTMKTVWDIRNGKEIDAREFFNQPESEIMHMRRVLQIAITTRKPVFVCPMCHQMVKISGRKTQRGKATFFSHLYDSDNCPIKTTTEIPKERLLAEKYKLVAESERHIVLKNKISQHLMSPHSVQMGVSEVEVEKRVDSAIPYMRWRRPDVQAIYKGKRIVFELQLSTTFISTIVDRDLFYRLNDYYILWVFNFEDNQEYVNLSNLMCKDIYYANKRNVFIFDDEAQKESERRGQLILKCNWLNADNEWYYKKKNGNAGGIFVSLDQLTCDEDSKKLYYYDADADYFSKHPDLIAKRKHWEISREEILKSLMEKETIENDEYEGQSQQKRNLAVQEMLKKGEQVEIFKKKNKYGLSYEDTIIIPAKYSFISDYDENGFATLKNNRSKGLVDRIGNIIVPCEATEINILDKHIIVYRKSNTYWFLSGIKEAIAPYYKDEVSLNKIDDHVEEIKIQNTTKKHPNYIIYVIERKIVLFRDGSSEDGKWGAKYLFGEIVLPFVYDNVSCEDGRILVMGENKNGILDYWMNEIIPPIYSSLIFDKDKYITQKGPYSGIVYKDGKILFECKFDLIKKIEDKYILEKGGKWALADKDGTIIFHYQDNPIVQITNKYLYLKDQKGLSFLSDYLGNYIKWDEGYSYIQETENPNLFIVTLSSEKKKGIVNISGKTIIPCKFDDVVPWGNHIFRAEYSKLVIFNNIWGWRQYSNFEKRYYLFNEDGQNTSSDIYKSLGKLVEGKIYAITEDNRSGFLDEEGKYIPDKSEFVDGGFIKIYSFERWGLTNQNRDIILPCKFLEIERFSENLFKVKTSQNKYKLYDLTGACKSKAFQIIENLKDGYAIADDTYLNSHGQECFRPLKTLPNGNIIGHNHNHYGLYSKDGNILSEPIYSQIMEWGNNILVYYSNSHEHRRWISIHNLDGEEIGIQKYDNIEPYISGKCKAWIGDEFSYLNDKGQEIFDIISTMPDGNSIIKNFGFYGILDSSDIILLPVEYSDIHYLDTNTYIVKDSTSYKLIGEHKTDIDKIIITEVGEIKDGIAEILIKDKGWCKIDKNGNYLPMSLSRIRDICVTHIFGQCIIEKNGTVIVESGVYTDFVPLCENRYKAVLCKNNKSILLNDKLEEIKTEEIYDDFYYIEETGHIISMIKNRLLVKFGLLSIDGKTLQLPSFASLKYEKTAHVYVANNNRNKYVIIKKNGKEIVPGELDRVELREEGGITLYKDNLTEHIDSNGNIIFGTVEKSDSNHIIFQWFGKYGIASEEGEIKLSPFFSSIKVWNNGYNDIYICNKQDNKIPYLYPHTLVRSDGSIIINDSIISPFIKGKANVETFDRNYYIDEQGEPIRTKKRLFENIYLTSCEGLFGLKDSNSNVILEEKYKEINPLHDGLFELKEYMGKWGLANMNGEVLIPCINDCIISCYGELICLKGNEIIKTGIAYHHTIPIILKVKKINYNYRGLILQIGKKTAFMSEATLNRYKQSINQYKCGDYIKVIINQIDWFKERLYAKILQPKQIDYIEGLIIDAKVSSKMPYALIVKDEDENNIFIHKSMLSSLKFKSLKEGEKIKVIKVGFDLEHNKIIWKIIDESN